MKRFINFFAALFLLTFTQQAIAQQYTCSTSSAHLYTVAAESGLSLRATPSLSSEKILAVPHGRTISVCTDDMTGQEVIEGVKGRWVRAFYANKSGYMFDGFLKRQEEISVIQSELWIDEETKDRPYWGLYPANENPYAPEFRVSPCSFVEDTIQMSEGDPFVATVMKGEANPLFLFSGIEVDEEEIIHGHAFDHKFLFPGESFYLRTDKASYYLYAKGQIQLSKDPDSGSPFSMIRNYELRVRRVMNGAVEDQMIYRMDLPHWLGDQYGGGIHLQWVGDLDRDGELDVLLSKASEEDCWEIICLLSSKAEPGQYFRQVSSYTECSGC
ncbi:MAG: SH3 domain-containing protein [Bacteroidota bacterium]